MDVAAVELAAIAGECWQTVDTEPTTLSIETDRSIMAVETRLRQLLENLLRNAVHHGGDQVTVGDTETGFYVEDNGPGIPPEDRDRIYERGFSSTSEGTGFGLSIVDQIVTAHDWTIQATEGEDGGARFEITGVEFDST